MLIRRIKLQNLLSFGPEAQDLELGPLNVLIGPNGSGKSNVIEAIRLLQAAPADLVEPIRAGGAGNRIWRGRRRHRPLGWRPSSKTRTASNRFDIRSRSPSAASVSR